MICAPGIVDLVTETDKKCEEIIFSSIRDAFPDHKFIGEEDSAAQVGRVLSRAGSQRSAIPEVLD